jgi:hypothetical protein
MAASGSQAAVADVSVLCRLSPKSGRSTEHGLTVEKCHDRTCDVRIVSFGSMGKTLERLSYDGNLLTSGVLDTSKVLAKLGGLGLGAQADVAR